MNPMVRHWHENRLCARVVWEWHKSGSEVLFLDPETSTPSWEHGVIFILAGHFHPRLVKSSYKDRTPFLDPIDPETLWLLWVVRWVVSTHPSQEFWSHAQLTLEHKLVKFTLLRKWPSVYRDDIVPTKGLGNVCHPLPLLYKYKVPKLLWEGDFLGSHHFASVILDFPRFLSSSVWWSKIPNTRTKPNMSLFCFPSLPFWTMVL